MGAPIKKFKKMPISRYGFPRKVKIVSPKRGRPKRSYLKKVEIFNEFCEWASLPTPLRDPREQQEFGKKWGVTPATLSAWKKDQRFWETVASIRRDWAKDKTSDVIFGLFKNASTRGEAAEVKLWLQAVEDWSEKVAPPTKQITVIGIHGLLDSDLKKLLQPVEDKNDILDAEIVGS